MSNVEGSEMISITYKDLKKMDACTEGLYNFVKPAMIARRVFNRPVSLMQLAKEHPVEDEVHWLCNKLAFRMFNEDRKAVVSLFLESLTFQEVESSPLLRSLKESHKNKYILLGDINTVLVITCRLARGMTPHMMRNISKESCEKIVESVLGYELKNELNF